MSELKSLWYSIIGQIFVLTGHRLFGCYSIIQGNFLQICYLYYFNPYLSSFGFICMTRTFIYFMNGDISQSHMFPLFSPKLSKLSCGWTTDIFSHFLPLATIFQYVETKADNLINCCTYVKSLSNKNTQAVENAKLEIIYYVLNLIPFFKIFKPSENVNFILLLFLFLSPRLFLF